MEDRLRGAVMDRILDYFSCNNTVMSYFVSIIFEGGFPQHREGRLLNNISRVAKVGPDESLVEDAVDGSTGAQSGWFIRASEFGQDFGEVFVAII